MKHIEAAISAHIGLVAKKQNNQSPVFAPVRTLVYTSSKKRTNAKLFQNNIFLIGVNGMYNVTHVMKVTFLCESALRGIMQ